jgi:hypothetical protein
MQRAFSKFLPISVYQVTGILSEWLLFNANSAIVQLYHGENKVNFQWDDDEVRFVLDQYAKLDFYSVSSMKQQSAITGILHICFFYWCLEDCIYHGHNRHVWWIHNTSVWRLLWTQYFACHTVIETLKYNIFHQNDQL